jgi:nucleotide-binding universal stress UspA family protein
MAVDLSESSATSIPHISQLIRELKGSLSLIYVVKSYLKDWMSSGNIEREAQQRLEHWMELIASEGIPAGQIIVKVGNVADNICITADLLKADLIIICAGKKSFVNRHHTGTTAETVVRHASQSVWVHKTPIYSGIKKVLCGVDMSENATLALNKAISVCRTFNARLDVLHAIKEPNIESLGVSLQEKEERMEHFKMKKTEEFENYLNGFDVKGLDRKTLIVWGSASKAILSYATDEQTDLIVLGATGKSNLKRVMMGSTAEKVLCATPCSLLIVR